MRQLFSSASHKVYWGLCRVPEQQGAVEVAIRVVNLELLEDIEAMATLRSEVQAMRQLNHPSILRYYTSFTVEDTLWIVMELAHHGSVRALMSRSCPNGFSEATCVYILYHVLLGLAYLHEHEVVHRDIKGSHILVDKKGRIFLSSFSLSTFMLESGERKAATTLVGSLPWMGPEVLVHGKDRKYSTAVDIWSLGMTAIELAMGEAPYEKIAHEAMRMIKTVREDPPSIPPSQEFSKHYHNFVADCLQHDPEKRPTAAKLLEHRLFKKIKKTPEDYFMKLLPQLQSESESSGSQVFDRPRSESVLNFTDLQKDMAMTAASRTEEEWARSLERSSMKDTKNDAPAKATGLSASHAGLSSSSDDGTGELPRRAAALSESTPARMQGNATQRIESCERSERSEASEPSEGSEKSTHSVASVEDSAEHSSASLSKRDSTSKGEFAIRPASEEERARNASEKARREEEEKRAKAERAAKRVGGDDSSASETALAEKPQQRSIAVPIETYMGEDKQDYVILIRTITGTTLTFRIKGCEFIIAGELPPLPDLPGVQLRNTPVTKFEKKIRLPEEINGDGVRREKNSGTIVIRIRKSQVELGSVTM